MEPTLALITHYPNQHGYGVSLVKYEGDELTWGFTLNSLATREEQQKYARDLETETGWKIEDDEEEHEANKAACFPGWL
jgi:hypothetical protein